MQLGSMLYQESGNNTVWKYIVQSPEERRKFGTELQQNCVIGKLGREVGHSKDFGQVRKMGLGAPFLFDFFSVKQSSGPNSFVYNKTLMKSKSFLQLIALCILKDDNCLFLHQRSIRESCRSSL